MKILFILPRYHTNLNNWIKKLSDEGNTVRVVVYHNVKRNSNCPVPTDFIGFAAWYLRLKRILRIKCANSRCGVPDTRVLKKYLQNYRPDLIILRDPARVFSLFSIYFALRLHLKVLFYTQAPLYNVYSFWKKIAINTILNVLGICMMTPIKGEHGNKKVKRFFHIPFVADVPKRLERRGADGTFRILMIGKYIPRKNHVLLIDALSELTASGDISLTIIGAQYTPAEKEYFAYIRRYIQTKKIDDRISLEDPVPYELLQTMYTEYDLFVLPSRDEEVGVTVLEAMSRGLPVICSDTAGAADFIRNYSNGIVFHSDDKNSLRDALEYCAGDPVRCARMGRESLRIVEQYYNPNVFYRRLKLLKEKIYD